MTQPKAPWTRMPKYRKRAPKKAPKRGIKPRSKRMDLIMRKLYLPMRRKFLKDQECELFYAKATDIHHSRGRAGTLLIDERFWIPVSRKGHRLIEDDKTWAREKGYLCKKGLWNVPPHDAETERLRGLIAEVTRGK